jgi:Cytochrome b(N-terminal)/b6/petB
VAAWYSRVSSARSRALSAFSLVSRNITRGSAIPSPICRAMALTAYPVSRQTRRTACRDDPEVPVWTGTGPGQPRSEGTKVPQTRGPSALHTVPCLTPRFRRRALAALPPDKLLPDRQPAYVASWVYVFGVASLAALFMAIASGFTIAVGGTDWWHTNPVGHFFNSVHLWSVELFMAFLVIHLWGKFWMAAWRGRRALTWITGVVAFIASVVECFTGYLSQQNFDSHGSPPTARTRSTRPASARSST